MKHKFILLSLFLFLTGITSLAQSPNTLRHRCPNTSIYSIVQITGVGDITVNPCPGKTTTFTQNVVFPGGVVTNSLANGSAAAPSVNFQNSLTTGIYRAGADIFGLSSAGVANATFGAAADTFRSASHVHTNVAGTAEFASTFTPGAAALGSFQFGDSTGAGKTYISAVNSTGTIKEQGILYSAGDVDVTVNGTKISIVDSTNTIALGNNPKTAILSLADVINTQLNRTITAGGTTGAQTINKPNGSVNFAAGATTLVVTNSVALTNSTIFATAQTNDATCAVKDVERAAGSFTIRMTAACTAETAVAFVVFN